MHSGKNFLWYVKIVTVNVLITLVLMFFGLKAFQRAILLRDSVIPQHHYGYWHRWDTIARCYLYPYTGFHLRADYSDSYSGNKSGRMGFFNPELDVSNPPGKLDNEFRIILTGGSGAQGQGCRLNEEMLYRQLERHLNTMPAHANVKVRVINMAMGGSITYQNYIALNQFGHRLEPDLVVSYSGFNDYSVPLLIEGLPEVYYGFSRLNTMVYGTYFEELPTGLGWFKTLFPVLVQRTEFTTVVNSILGTSRLTEKATREYIARRGLKWDGKKEMMNEIAIPFYIHALKSIKRDLSGIPILVAWQCVSIHDKTYFKIAADVLGPDFYNEMFERMRRETQRYVNDQWYYVNVHKMFENDSSEDFSYHLTARGQRIVAETLAERLAPVISASMSRRSVR